MPPAPFAPYVHEQPNGTWIPNASASWDSRLEDISPRLLALTLMRAKVTRRFGGLKGKVRIADDFDAPLPDDVIAAFEGR